MSRRICVAAALLLAVAGCGAASYWPSSDAPPDVRLLPKRVVCLDVADAVCDERSNCPYRHWAGKVECKNQFVLSCCGASGTCAAPIEISAAHMSQCIRQVERNYDCQRSFTPACYGLISP